MSAYEWYLLIGSSFAVLAALSFSSVILDRGSVRIFGTLLAISLGVLYLAQENSENGINFNDLPPIINKLIGPLIRGDEG